MDVIASMHGPNLARDDRLAPPPSILRPLAAAQAARVTQLQTGALDAGILLKKAPVDASVGRRVNIFHSGSKRPRAENSVLQVAERDDFDEFGFPLGKTKHLCLSEAPMKVTNTKTVDGYMEARAQKLVEQADKPRTTIFAGMCIYITGRTGTLTAYHLQRLIFRHGGKVSLAPTVTEITHVLAVNLTGSKAERLLKRIGGKHISVIHPDYIVDCVKAKGRLPEAAYVTLKDDSRLRVDQYFHKQSSSLDVRKPLFSDSSLDDEHEGVEFISDAENLISEDCDNDDGISLDKSIISIT